MAPSKVRAAEAPWYDRAMRWAQLTLVDGDTSADSGYDVTVWLDYFRRIRADAACLSAGGYLAFYPTTVPFHRRSVDLGDQDPFGDLVAGCRELGMVVLARTDPHAVHDDVYQAHPEWIAVDAEGRPRPHWAMPGVWVTCALGEYATAFMPEVNAEIISTYDVDGIFSNRWAGSGRCFCEWCRKNFAAAAGLELPVGNDPTDPAVRAYRRWREDRLFEIARMWDTGIRELNPAARFIPNSGGGALSDLDMSRLADLAETLFADRQARSGTTPVWMNGQYAKAYRAAMGTKPVGGIFSVGIEEPQRWKDSVQSEAEIRIWVASGLANGLRPWFTKFGGTLPDRRWLDVVADLYQWLADIEPYLRNEAPLARVGIVYSQQTAGHYGDRAREMVQQPLDGFYHALVEARIPFEMVHDRRLDPAALRAFRTLILPNVACLSDAQCAAIREFVRAGGRVVATQQTSLFDENGDPRDDFGLGDLFGVRRTGELRGPLHNSYLELRDDESGARHPLLAGLEGTTRIINSVHLTPVEATSSTGRGVSPLTLIDSYPDLPMEEVYRRDREVGPPQVFAGEYGEGRYVYFPGDLDRTFSDNQVNDLRVILTNAVTWATDEPAQVEVDGQGVIEVTAWRQRDSMTVHLVNLTNPMMMKGPYRELIPSPRQRLRIRIPAGTHPRRVHLLRRGEDVAYTVEAGVIELAVESVLDIEIVAIDLAATGSAHS
ncbi:alpha-amylase family protein [Actinopolymorpha alba]|uniref:alpha-amylase family protein n=1 Tax=Actinopolymorpha alba TaxID=533267 RepID=UPI000369925B|nr:alpha-amylase family protein [Actinopolymorpha alba]